MYVQRYIVRCSRKHCCHGNTAMRSFFTFDVDVVENNIKVLCCQGNATCSLCTVAEQQNISYCC